MIRPTALALVVLCSFLSTPSALALSPGAGSLRPNTRDFRAVRKRSGNTDVASTHDAYTMLKPTNDTHQQTDGNFLLVSGDKLVVPELRKEFQWKRSSWKLEKDGENTKMVITVREFELVLEYGDATKKNDLYNRMVAASPQELARLIEIQTSRRGSIFQ